MAIKILDSQTALKIAAGEVIERPASVVKELVENSLDAGATNIRVEIKNGGLNYLRVSDDGQGIPYAEVPVAFERHATSKIQQAEDLYNLSTLGFRGEALPSIAAVSQMTLLTRSRTETETGSEITIEGGKQVYHRPAGAPGGTIITVRNLFFNLPARQKWARSGTHEAGHILNIINNYALAYPEVKFSLMSEGRLLLQTSGNGDLKDAVSKIYGADAAAAMLTVDSFPLLVDEDGVIQSKSEAGQVRVYGLTAEPSFSKPNRNFMTFFVNRRWVVSRTLSFAVQEAYHSLLQTGRYPVCVLLIEVDPAQVDANVHPAKTEVRFLKERAVFQTVQKGVREALLANAGGAVWEAPDPTIFANPTAQMLNTLFAPTPVPDPAQEQQARLDLPAAAPPPVADDDDWLMDEVHFVRPTTKPGQNNQLDNQPEPPENHATGQPERSTVESRPAQPVETQPELLKMRARLPLLRVLGQMANTYVVAEGPDGMYLIDQHAAHERVMYEQFQARLKGRQLDSQLLLEPVLLDLPSRQRLLLSDTEKQAELKVLGFDLQFADEDGAIWLKAVPVSLLGRDLKLGLSEMIDEAEGLRDNGCTPGHDEQTESELPRSWRDKLGASLACHSAVRGGQVLTLEEMRELIGQLERTSLPNACAHGRPTMMHLSQGQLERGFGRK